MTPRILGEAMFLSSLKPTPLRRPVVAVQAVWGVDVQGARVDFKEGMDWQHSSLGIARTPGSHIPDFAHYSFSVESDGSFLFSSEPRNPPLILPYQVYVDYSSTHPDTIITPAAGAVRPRSVVCLGDSIAAGAHTLANYFQGSDTDSYCGLLRTQLGPTTTVLNPSTPGGTLTSALPNLPAIIDSKPELLIMAFGMNDHIAGQQALPVFEANLVDAVQATQAAGIRVILIGFFQQNTRWALENPAMTLAYNQAIERVANRTKAVFIDVWGTFDRSAPDGRIIESRTGDFMHHPNNYGHRVYFSMLLPHVLDTAITARAVPAYVDPQ